MFPILRFIIIHSENNYYFISETCFMLTQKLFAKNWGESGTYFFFPENALCIAGSRVPVLPFVHVPITYRLFIIISNVHKMQDQTSVTESFIPTCTHVCVVPVLYLYCGPYLYCRPRPKNEYSIK